MKNVFQFSEADKRHATEWFGIPPEYFVLLEEEVQLEMAEAEHIQLTIHHLRAAMAALDSRSATADLGHAPQE